MGMGKFIRRKLWLIIVIIVVILGAGIGLKRCHKKAAAALNSNAKQDTYTVAKGKIVSKVEITGEVQPQTVVQIKSKVSGKIVRFYVDENNYVKSGDIIADVEPDYNQASTLASIKAQLQTAEIRQKNARKDYADKQELLKQNFITQKEVDTAKDELDTSQSEFLRAQQQYNLVKELDTNSTVVHIYATTSGTVISRPVQEGEMITSSNSAYGEGSVIVKVANLTRMIVKSNINEVDITKFRLGQTADIALDALPYDTFRGKITKVAPMATTDNNAKVFPVEISIDSAVSRLKPGMTANVTIVGQSKDNVLVIPIRAVFTDTKNQDIVYLVKDTLATAPVKTAGKKPAVQLPAAPQPVATPVKLGSNDMENVEVVEGLKAGDKISLTEPGSSNKANMMFQMD